MLQKQEKSRGAKNKSDELKVINPSKKDEVFLLTSLSSRFSHSHDDERSFICLFIIGKIFVKLWIWGVLNGRFAFQPSALNAIISGANGKLLR